MMRGIPHRLSSRTDVDNAVALFGASANVLLVADGRCPFLASNTESDFSRCQYARGQGCPPFGCSLALAGFNSAQYARGCWDVNTRLGEIGVGCPATAEFDALTNDERNNIRCPDMSGITENTQFSVTDTTQILSQSETWELSVEQPGVNTLSVWSVVKQGSNFYLFYAHHDTPTGIGCAVASAITGPYVKISPPDSRVIKASSDEVPYHFSSPCVLWNADTQLWHCYFHYWQQEWEQGRGHQKTGLATCSDLATGTWTILIDSNGDPAPILPVTAERWMNSQSSYHLFQRLPNGKWFCFLHGIGGEYQEAGWVQDVEKLGFAVSDDGISWTYFDGNPIAQTYHAPQAWGWDGQQMVALWMPSDMDDAVPLTAALSDVVPTIAVGSVYDAGVSSVWRDSITTYLFAGTNVIEMEIVT
ncbi:MAG: hypothetical protein WC654_00730 [Patescibacteria group bacterium]